MTFAVVILAVVLTGVVLWAVLTAQRLNRLYIRTDAARQQLEAALDLRATVAAMAFPSEAGELSSGVNRDLTGRAEAERRVSQILLSHSGQLPTPLVEATTRVSLAYRFYNNAVRDTRALRLRPLVRILHLGGNAQLPEYFEVPVAVDTINE